MVDFIKKILNLIFGIFKTKNVKISKLDESIKELKEQIEHIDTDLKNVKAEDIKPDEVVEYWDNE